MRRGVSATGALHPNAVWERYATPSEWPSWAHSTRRIWGAQEGHSDGVAYRSQTAFGCSAPVADTPRLMRSIANR